jgi:GrpB-like predicted nucleotidyltransferase (UPF0157 family)
MPARSLLQGIILRVKVPLGMLDEVIVADYNDDWPRLFVEERALLTRVLADSVRAVEHVGSTSVPGLAAKPIIDVLVVMRRLMPIEGVDAVCAIGYRYFGPYGIEGRQFFSKGPRGTHHLHCFVEGNVENDRTVLFRDYLRAHVEEARRYEALKRELAVTCRTDRTKYTDGKSALVREMDGRALEWWRGRGSPRLVT